MGIIFFSTIDYIVPLFCVSLAYSHNPIYAMLEFSETLSPRNSPLAKILLGFLVWVTSIMLASTIRPVILIFLYGIVSLYLWTLFLVPTSSSVKFCLSFAKGVKIYRTLKVMTLVMGELASDIVVPRVHHVCAVLWTTLALYFLMTHIFLTGETSPYIVILCVAMILISALMEWFAIGMVAMGATLSKRFIREMGRNHGRNKYRRRVVGSLLPNFINLEFVTTVNTIREGIQRVYFANFVARVTNNTITLLLARIM